MSFENTVGKGEIARNKQFLFFQVFSTHLVNFGHFIEFKIVVWKVFQFGSLNFVI